MKKDYYFIIIGIALLASAIYFVINQQNTITSLSIEIEKYKNLSKDTVFIPGKIDTLTKTKTVEKKIYIPVVTDREIDTTVVIDLSRIRVHTVDSSICIDVDLEYREIEVFRIDTLRIPVLKEVIVERPKEFDYKLLSVGVAAGAALTLAVIQIFR